MVNFFFVSLLFIFLLYLLISFPYIPVANFVYTFFFSGGSRFWRLFITFFVSLLLYHVIAAVVIAGLIVLREARHLDQREVE